jgi:hypothetical protein
MTVESERIKRIQKRWTDEHKVSGADVEWLLQQANNAETMRAARNLRDATRSPSERLIDNLFGFDR